MEKRERIALTTDRDAKNTSGSWETPGAQRLHWVCLGDDVSVNYNSVDRHVNKSDCGPQYVLFYIITIYE